jgi:hypothetical protein
MLKFQIRADRGAFRSTSHGRTNGTGLKRLHLIIWLISPVLALSGSIYPAISQSSAGATLESAAFPVLKQQRKTPPPPLIRLKVLEEIPLPGPLDRSHPPKSSGSMVYISLGQNIARVDLSDPSASHVELSVSDHEHPFALEPEWVHGGKKDRLRFQTLPEGMLVAQKRSSFRAGSWQDKWSLRTPGGTPGAPLVVGKKILFGCNDNRIYALKLQNGHRLWFQDMGHRVYLPLVHWRGELPITVKKSGKTVSIPQSYDLILVVPHPGINLQVLDSFDGKSLASKTIGAPGNGFEGEFVTEPAVLEDGRIVIAVQKYKESDASLLILGIVPATPDDSDSG